MSSVFKIYSPEDCDFYYDGELQGHIEGNSKKAFRFEVERKGAYRLVFINSEYQTELMIKVSINANEEQEVELDFSEVNEPLILKRKKIKGAIEHDYEYGEDFPEEIISAISKNGIVTIPKGVRKIGRRAFLKCSNLKSITIPDSVTEIGMGAFYGCSSLISIIIPNSVTKIQKSAFNGCSSLTSITIPNGVIKIESLAFEGCSCLSSITIPDSVTKIGNMAFYDCSSLTSVTIPDSITEIGEGAFSRCSSLTAFYGKYASNDNRCLIKEGRLLAFAPYDITKYTIPNSVTEIEMEAFSGCSSLTSITIPDGVTKIESFAFCDCSSLPSITIPNGVTEIKSYAFNDCSSLTSITIPNSVTEIGEGAFSHCSLTSITIPNGVTKIESLVFEGCGCLSSITIPNSITEIGEGAFSRCSSLTAFYGKYASNDNRCLIKGGRLLAFAPYDIAIYTIPNGVSEIESAFICCSGLTSITIPNSVTEIGGWAFRDCSSLTSVYCKATNPPRIDPTFDPFQNTASDLKIYVTKSEGLTVLEAYKSAECWEDYADIIEEYDYDNK